MKRALVPNTGSAGRFACGSAPVSQAVSRLSDRKFLWGTIGLVVVAVVILVVSSCQSKLLAISGDNPLFTGAPFTERGWQGIVPGETSMDEALSILKDSPHVTHVYTTGTRYQGVTYKYIRWFGKTPCQPLDIANEIIVIDNGVLAIQVCLGEDTFMTMEEAITQLGEPKKTASHEAGGPEMVYWSVCLLYPDRGFALEAAGLGPMADRPIVKVYYFEPTTPSEFRDNPISELMHMDLKQMEDWAGY